MLEFKNLEGISLTELTQTFNAAFSDYLVKLELTDSLMLQKLSSENIKLDLSYGAYQKDELVGFILNAINSDNFPHQIYNAGTGVIPTFRGLRIIEQLYSFTVKELEKKGFVNHQLEVAIKNEKAKKVYEKTGFKIYRDLTCYKGKLAISSDSKFKVNVLNAINLEEVKQFWNYDPTWQNNNPTVNRMMDRLTILVVESKDSLIGYCIFNKDTGRINQLGVKKEHRNKGVGKSLINCIVHDLKLNELTILNIDKRDIETNQFLKNLGFETYIDQFEMKLELNN